MSIPLIIMTQRLNMYEYLNDARKDSDIFTGPKESIDARRKDSRPAGCTDLGDDDVHLSAELPQRGHQLFRVAVDAHPAAVHEYLGRAGKIRSGESLNTARFRAK